MMNASDRDRDEMKACKYTYNLKPVEFVEFYNQNVFDLFFNNQMFHLNFGIFSRPTIFLASETNDQINKINSARSFVYGVHMATLSHNKQIYMLSS